VLGRNTQGVTLIKVQEGEKLVQVARVAESIEEDAEASTEPSEQAIEGSVEDSSDADTDAGSNLGTDEASSATDAPEQE
jgi:DNA gyrase subunit A